MQYLFDSLIARLTQPKKANKFWEDHRSSEDGLVRKLKNEELIQEELSSIFDGLGVNQGQYMVKGACVFGSVVNVRGDSHYYRGPQDIDIYVYVNEKNIEIAEEINIKVKELFKSYFSCDVDCVVSEFHPFDHYEFTGDLRRLSYSKIYSLYVNPTLLQDNSNSNN